MPRRARPRPRGLARRPEPGARARDPGRGARRPPDPHAERVGGRAAHRPRRSGGRRARALASGPARRCWSRSARAARCCFDRRGRRCLPATTVDVVDTTGAGDTVNGALAAELAAGASLADAARFALAAAALSTRARRRARRDAAAGGRQLIARAVRGRGRARASRPGRRGSSRGGSSCATSNSRSRTGRRSSTGLRAGVLSDLHAGRAARRAGHDPPRGRRAQRARARRAPAARRLPRREPGVAALSRAGGRRDRARAAALTARHGRRDRQPRLAQLGRPDVARAGRRRDHRARGPRRAISATFWVAGMADMRHRRPNVGRALRDVPPDGAADRPLARPRPVPRACPSASRSRLSGHTHGGQVAIPLLRRPLMPSHYGERYARGHVVEHGRHLLVTSGVGTSGTADPLPRPTRSSHPDLA